jgi:hypothetical protein
MLNRIAELLGRRRIVLIDHDGEETKRWAKPTVSLVLGVYKCYRWRLPASGRCILYPDGSVEGPSYVEKWYKL